MNRLQSSGETGAAWVHEALDPDQLSTGKRRYSQRKLGLGITILFWALRIYVVMMFLLVGLLIWNTFHGAK